MPSFFSISYVVPNPARAFKVTHVKYIFHNVTGQLASNCFCPAIHTVPDVLLQWASDTTRTRLAVGLCRKLRLALVCCGALQCVPRCFQRLPRVLHICQTQFERSDITVVRKICADLVGSQRHKNMGPSLSVKSEHQLCKQEL